MVHILHYITLYYIIICCVCQVSLLNWTGFNKSYKTREISKMVRENRSRLSENFRLSFIGTDTTSTSL